MTTGRDHDAGVTLDEYMEHDAVALANLVRRGDVTADELLQLAVLRKEQVNNAVNAITSTLTDFANAEMQFGMPDGPFRGVPLLLKDQIDVAGLPTGRACRLLNGHKAKTDSNVVARFREAGFVIFGKTNMPELGLNVTTEPKMHGPTLNPWSPDCSAGGSSGGSAAAVACGIVPAASATDGGGSIRIPASCCGVFGLKPSRGRISFGPDAGEGWGGLTAHGVVTRSVRDTAALLDVLSGPAVGDPYQLDSEPGAFLHATRMKPGALKVGVVTKPPTGTRVHPDCRAAIEDCVNLLESFGHQAIPTEYPIDGAQLRDAAGMIIRTKVAASLEAIACGQVNGDDLEAATWMIYEAGRATNGIQYAAAIDSIHAIGRQMGHFMEDFDVILSPTLAEPPIRLGVLNTETTDGMALFQRMREYSPFCNLFNATGQPAMSVPLCWNASNLPIGVQFAAAYGNEQLLIRLASQLEAARPWWQRYRWLKV